MCGMRDSHEKGWGMRSQDPLSRPCLSNLVLARCTSPWFVICTCSISFSTYVVNWDVGCGLPYTVHLSANYDFTQSYFHSKSFSLTLLGLLTSVSLFQTGFYYYYYYYYYYYCYCYFVAKLNSKRFFKFFNKKKNWFKRCDWLKKTKRKS